MIGEGNVDRRTFINVLLGGAMGLVAAPSFATMIPSAMHEGVAWDDVWSRMNVDLFSTRLEHLGFVPEQAAELSRAVFHDEVKEALVAATSAGPAAAGEKSIRMDLGRLQQRLAQSATLRSTFAGLAPESKTRLGELRSQALPGSAGGGMLASQLDLRGDLRITKAEIREILGRGSMQKQLAALGFSGAEIAHISRLVEKSKNLTVDFPNVPLVAAGAQGDAELFLGILGLIVLGIVGWVHYAIWLGALFFALAIMIIVAMVMTPAVPASLSESMP
jgi:hypothetical protein